MRVCGPSALICARLRRLDFRRLLPFCCPDAARSTRRHSPCGWSCFDGLSGACGRREQAQTAMSRRDGLRREHGRPEGISFVADGTGILWESRGLLFATPNDTWTFTIPDVVELELD